MTDSSMLSGGTPDDCFDFCIWKLGRRQERRRLHAILREEAKRKATAEANAIANAEEVDRVLAMSVEDLQRELE